MMLLISLSSPAIRTGFHGGTQAAKLPPARATAPRCDIFAPPTTPSADRERIMLDWLQDNGVYISGQSTWGRPAHPMRVESDTVEDFEPAGRGLIARKQILQGERGLSKARPARPTCTAKRLIDRGRTELGAAWGMIWRGMRPSESQQAPRSEPVFPGAGEPVMQINMKFVMTKERAQAVLGRQMVPDSMGEYIAIALLLMHERLQGAASF